MAKDFKMAGKVELIVLLKIVTLILKGKLRALRIGVFTELYKHADLLSMCKILQNCFAHLAHIKYGFKVWLVRFARELGDQSYLRLARSGSIFTN